MWSLAPLEDGFDLVGGFLRGEEDMAHARARLYHYRQGHSPRRAGQ